MLLRYVVGIKSVGGREDDVDREIQEGVRDDSRPECMLTNLEDLGKRFCFLFVELPYLFPF